MTQQRNALRDKLEVLTSRVIRSEERLEKMKTDAYQVREQFANAVKMCDTSQMQETGKRYVDRMTSIAHAELIMLQATIERSAIEHRLKHQ